MHHVIAIRQALIFIYRSSLIICFSLSMGCENCSGNQNKNKKLPVPGQQPLLAPQFLLKKSNTGLAGVHEADLDGSDKLESCINIQEIKKLKKRVAKVDEDQQAIVCLHGLHRLSWDFNKMKGALQEKFPHATIVALTCVDKDPNKKGPFSPSPTVELPIERQAELAYEEIRKKIGRGKHVVIVGHSQGGLRGFTLVKDYSSRLKSEDGIVINQLITIGTPWKGAPVMGHIKNAKRFKENFEGIKTTLDSIHKNYSEAVRGYFFKFMPRLASAWPRLYETIVPRVMSNKYPGAADLEPASDFIRGYVASGLQEISIPITAIAGILIDFSKLFEPFPSSIGPQALAQLNATYAALIGGDRTCEHDMLLPVATQHAEGLVTKDFKRIKVYGACHGNKVGVSIKSGLSELNNKEVIQRVVESIEEAFYEEKEEPFVEEGGVVPPAA